MSKNNGFSLIEVLITLVLTTIGILGVVAMQTRSIQYTQDSVQRNAAVALAGELVEIMRANPQLVRGAQGGMLNNNSSMLFKSRAAGFNPAPASCADPASAKTAQQQRDCWIAKVRRVLPGADGLLNSDFYMCRSPSISNAVAPVCADRGTMIEIQLAWTVKEGGCIDDRAPNETTCIYRTRVEL
ncbi:type IV pilus modification protein PilV [Pseudomonas sp. PDM16]|uniref:type IV pilus modification protein PilV n=1 Tax=Pseudomonas sp. PDM16 TaxID=2769292 RepID=UPI0017853231|nr:type IV pilus modification protein PilV [Pseudomonas sp. PDM16]MBD9415627.1 type IV pilus modification protein PilV [Pseudomonas sp. PDM16]